MNSKTALTRRRAVVIVAAVAAVLFALIFMRWQNSEKDKLMTTEGREMFLSELGWEIDPESESYKSVLLPQTLEGIMEEYNRLQLEQGFDLSQHCGEECDQFCYTVTNYPNCESSVYATLYLQNGKLIAADIHSTAIDGFMHGIFSK